MTDHMRYINGLKPSDIRVLEDGIVQKIFIFAEGSEAPLLVNDDGTTRPLDAQATSEASKPGLDLDASKSALEDLDNSYTITYYPNASNHNEGFREIRFEIVPDMVAKKWRVRSRPGYRPEKRIPEDQRK